MGNVKVSGGGLNFSAKLDISDAVKKAQDLKKTLSDLSVSGSAVNKGMESQKSSIQGIADAIKANTAAIKAQSIEQASSIKPLTDYQAKQIEIKQQALDLAKAKQEADRADKAAALDRMAALRDERLAREQIITQIAKNRLATQEAAKNPVKRVTDISSSQAEIDALNRAQRGSILYTSAINAEIVAKARLNTETAKQAIANGGLTPIINTNVSASQQQASATNKVILSKQQLAQMLSEEKYRQQQSTAELKNNSREMLNAKGSLEQRKAALERLVTAYGRLTIAERESASGSRMADIIKGVRDQVRGLEDQTKSSRGGISGLFDSIKSNIVSTLGPLALITAAWAALKAAFSHNVEISDTFVDVQRTAKLSADQVDELGNELKKINTRTNLEGLLDIGFIGGRLGVSQDEMVGFIKQVDELSVVLKKELPGGAEAVATSLGKIITVYKLTQREGITLEDALRKVGSSLLEVSHNGGAPVAYLQEFALKTASIAQVANISLPTILAYGAVLSKAGVQASTAATGVTRLISDLSTKRDKYFAIAQLADSTLTLEKFTKLINTDTKSALELFFKGLKAGNPTQTETADRLQTLHLTAGRVKTTVISLSEAQEQLFEKTAIANKGYEEGTSIAHNFELANNSLSAAFDKIGNSIANAFTSSDISRKLAALLNFITDNRTEAEKLTDAYVNNKASLDNLESSLSPAVKRYDELKSKVKLTTTEQEELRKVTVLIGNLLPGVITAFDNYGNAIDINRGKVQELNKAQRELLELQNRDAVKKANKQFNSSQEDLTDAKAKALELQKETTGLYEFVFGDNAPQSLKTLRSNAKDKITSLSGSAYEAAKAIRTLGGELTKAQKDVLNYYEVVNKPKPKKVAATIVGDGTETDTTDTGAARTIDDIKADIKRVTELKKPLDTASKQYKYYVEQLKGFKKELKLANGGDDTEGVKAANQYKTALKARNDLQAQIDILTKKGTDKQLSADDQELESVRDKYAKMKEAAITFNNDPVNKSKGLRVDAGGLLRAQDKELVAVRDKQDAEKLKTSLDAQKKLYDDYEAYKVKVGTESADKLYKDLADKTYLQYLNAKRDSLINGDSKAKGGVDVDPAAVQLQLKVVDEKIALEVENQKADLRNLLAYYASYEQQRASIIKTGTDNEVKLRKDGANEQADLARKDMTERLTELDEGKVRQLESYKELFDGIVVLTTKQAKGDLDNIQRYIDAKLKAGTITKQAYDEINKQLGLKGLDIANELPEKLKAVGSELSNIGSLASKFDEGMGDALSKVGGLVSGVGSIKENLNNINSSSSTSLSKITSGLGIVGTAIGVFSAIYSLFDNSKEKAEQLAYANDLQLKATEAVNKALERQLNLTKQIQGPERISAYKKDLADILADQAKNQALINTKFTLSGIKDIDEDLTKRNNGERGNYFLDSAIEQFKHLGAISSLAGKSIEDLQKLLDTGKLDQATAALVQSQIDLQQKAIDTKNALNEEITGINFDSLNDSIKDVFASGEVSAQKFADVIEKSIQGAFANAFERNEVEKAMQPFYDQLTAAGNDGVFSKSEIDQLKKSKDDIAKALSDKAKAYQQILGPDDTSSFSSSSLSGQISASLTEDTATRLYGVLAGTQLATVQIKDLLIPMGKTIGDLYETAKGSFDALVRIDKNTLRTADNTDTLIDVRKVLISIDTKMSANSNALAANGRTG